MLLPVKPAHGYIPTLYHKIVLRGSVCRKKTGRAEGRYAAVDFHIVLI